MKLKSLLLLSSLLLAAPAAVQAQFTFTTNADGISVTITGYTGSSNDVIIPSTLNGLSVTGIGTNAFFESDLTSVTIPISVTTIGDYAFTGCDSLTGVTIPDSVINIGKSPFNECVSLTAIDVGPNNPAYVSIAGVLFNYTQTKLIEYPCGLPGSYTVSDRVSSIEDSAFNGCEGLTNVTIGNNVTSIGNDAFVECNWLSNVTIGSRVATIGGGAFDACESLSNVTIPNSVTNIGSYAFANCVFLTSVYFQGDAPAALPTVFAYIYYLYPTVYYLPGTVGWGLTFANHPLALWTLPYPLILNSTPNFGVQDNQFGFTVSWATNLSVVVEASGSLANPVWQPLQTNTPSGGSFYFSDPQWTNYPGRFYRLRTSN